MEKIVIEVGSTCTKIDRYNGEEIEHISTTPIQFKRNYLNLNKLDENDVESLISLVNSVKEDDVFVCGTSIFRQLDEEKRNNFLNEFKKRTGREFNIISQEEENIYTVKGATRKFKDAVVFVGGGGSTEISYVENGQIKEMKNNKIGVMDILKIYPDLADDIATTSLEEVMKYIEERIEVPDVQTDYIILAGGGHEYFARESGVRYEEEKKHGDKYASICMNMVERIEDTNLYFTDISLDEIRSRVDEPDWWYATRAMCAFVLVVAEKIGAKVVVPTNISMIHGIVL